MSQEQPQTLFLSLLKETSRSFYIGISALQKPEKFYICNAYLFCRLIDIFEDSTVVSPEYRSELIAKLIDYLRALPGSSAELDQSVETFRDLYQKHQSSFVPYFEANPHEKGLIQNAEILLKHIGSFPEFIRGAFFSSFVDMALGMQKEIAFQSAQSDRRSRENLEEYCYAVAGTVGIFLTQIFWNAKAFVSTKSLAELERLGDHFGRSLQIVNITKDFHKDWSEGRCFWPMLKSPLTNSQVSSFPDASELKMQLGELQQMHLAHQAQAEEYLKQIGPQRKDILFFCHFPFEMAKLNMQLAGGSYEWLRSAQSPKISKLDTLTLLGKLSAQYEIPTKVLLGLG